MDDLSYVKDKDLELYIIYFTSYDFPKESEKKLFENSKLIKLKVIVINILLNIIFQACIQA